LTPLVGHFEGHLVCERSPSPAMVSMCRLLGDPAQFMLSWLKAECMCHVTCCFDVWACPHSIVYSLHNIHKPSMLWRCWLDIRKRIRPVKNWAMRCLHGYLSAARCKWFAYGPADATATLQSCSAWFDLSDASLPRLLFWKRGR